MTGKPFLTYRGIGIYRRTFRKMPRYWANIQECEYIFDSPELQRVIEDIESWLSFRRARGLAS